MPKKVIMKKGESSANVDEKRVKHYEQYGYTLVETKTNIPKINKTIVNTNKSE